MVGTLIKTNFITNKVKITFYFFNIDICNCSYSLTCVLFIMEIELHIVWHCELHLKKTICCQESYKKKKMIKNK